MECRATEFESVNSQQQAVLEGLRAELALLKTRRSGAGTPDEHGPEQAITLPARAGSMGNLGVGIYFNRTVCGYS